MAALALRYRFETFITGPANADAFAAAVAAAAAAGTPAVPGTPLVIVGGVGLGKTHLAHAIVEAARARRPRPRVAYYTAARLANEVAQALRRDREPAFARRLDVLELLVIDDLHGLHGRERTCLEIRRLLGRLGPGCQVVVLADRAPGELLDVPFLDVLPPGATVVTLGMPDCETRVRILDAWAAREGLELSPGVAAAVAEVATGSVRELEGALVRVAAHAFLGGRAVTVPFVREILAPALRLRPPRRPRRPRRPRPGVLRLVRPGASWTTPPGLLDGVRELAEFIRDVGGGRIGTPDVRGRDVFVALPARDGDRYTLRLRISREYLTRPLACTFVDARHRSTSTAWPYPAIGSPFHAPVFICVAPTSEYYESHPEAVYRRGEGTLVDTVAAVLTALQGPTYDGRFTSKRQRTLE
jgi:hypothetical protein